MNKSRKTISKRLQVGLITLMVALPIVAMSLLAISGKFDTGEVGGVYRMYAAASAWTAGFGALVALVNAFVLESKKVKLVAALLVVINLLFVLWGYFTAVFYITY